jgi:hypothetical protein
MGNGQLADALGKADIAAKAAAAEAQALKDELKARGIANAEGDHFAVTVTEQIAGRADVKALRAHLGDAYSRFEISVVSQVVRIKPSPRLAMAA